MTNEQLADMRRRLADPAALFSREDVMLLVGYIAELTTNYCDVHSQAWEAMGRRLHAETNVTGAGGFLTIGNHM